MAWIFFTRWKRSPYNSIVSRAGISIEASRTQPTFQNTVLNVVETMICQALQCVKLRKCYFKSKSLHTFHDESICVFLSLLPENIASPQTTISILKNFKRGKICDFKDGLHTFKLNNSHRIEIGIGKSDLLQFREIQSTINQTLYLSESAPKRTQMRDFQSTNSPTPDNLIRTAKSAYLKSQSGRSSYKRSTRREPWLLKCNARW